MEVNPALEWNDGEWRKNWHTESERYKEMLGKKPADGSASYEEYLKNYYTKHLEMLHKNEQLNNTYAQLMLEVTEKLTKEKKLASRVPCIAEGAWSIEVEELVRMTPSTAALRRHRRIAEEHTVKEMLRECSTTSSVVHTLRVGRSELICTMERSGISVRKLILALMKVEEFDLNEAGLPTGTLYGNVEDEHLVIMQIVLKKDGRSMSVEQGQAEFGRVIHLEDLYGVESEGEGKDDEA